MRADKWAKRDAQKEAEAAYYAEQERAETERLTKVIAPALRKLPVGLLVADGWSYTMDDLARVAVQALRDAGVIFASIAEDCGDHSDGTGCGSMKAGGDSLA